MINTHTHIHARSLIMHLGWLWQWLNGGGVFFPAICSCTPSKESKNYVFLRQTRMHYKNKWKTTKETNRKLWHSRQNHHQTVKHKKKKIIRNEKKNRAKKQYLEHKRHKSNKKCRNERKKTVQHTNKMQSWLRDNWTWTF